MQVHKSNPQPSRKRQIKVYYQYSPRAHNHWVQVPRIHLSGKWLERVEFYIGNTLSVYARKDLLIIKKGGAKTIVL